MVDIRLLGRTYAQLGGYSIICFKFIFQLDINTQAIVFDQISIDDWSSYLHHQLMGES